MHVKGILIFPPRPYPPRETEFEPYYKP